MADAQWLVNTFLPSLLLCLVGILWVHLLVSALRD